MPFSRPHHCIDFDEFDNPTGVLYPDGSQTRTTYHVATSNVLTETDERGTVTAPHYNGQGLRTRSTEAQGTPAERVNTYAYDAQGRVHGAVARTILRVSDERRANSMFSLESDKTTCFAVSNHDHAHCSPSDIRRALCVKRCQQMSVPLLTPMTVPKHIDSINRTTLSLWSVVSHAKHVTSSRPHTIRMIRDAYRGYCAIAPWLPRRVTPMLFFPRGA